MEILKKTVLQVLTTGTTSGGDIIITPDLDAVYNFKISLTGVVKDIGFFDAFVDEGQPYSIYPYVYGGSIPLGLGNLF